MANDTQAYLTESLNLRNLLSWSSQMRIIFLNRLQLNSCFSCLFCHKLHWSLCSWLQHLYNLVHVDLSYNNLRVLEAAHTRLGNIKTLQLAGNQLDQLTGLTKLYSLVNLDLSHNQLAQVCSSDEDVEDTRRLHARWADSTCAGPTRKKGPTYRFIRLKRQGIFVQIYISFLLNKWRALFDSVSCMRSISLFPKCACMCRVVVDCQLEEIRNIGSLPCLEKLNLSGNPVCIFPDYRTKVLAQFGDRAAEVQQHQQQHTVEAPLVVALHLLHRRKLPAASVAAPLIILLCVLFVFKHKLLLTVFSTVCLCVIRFVSTARWRQRRSWTRLRCWKPFRKPKKSKTGRAAVAVAVPAAVPARRYVLLHWAEEQQPVYTFGSWKTWWMFGCKCSTNLMSGCWPIPLFSHLIVSSLINTLPAYLTCMVPDLNI